MRARVEADLKLTAKGRDLTAGEADLRRDHDEFSQTLLPDYIDEHGVDWNVVYDARGHFEEPHTNRRIGCGPSRSETICMR